MRRPLGGVEVRGCRRRGGCVGGLVARSLLQPFEAGSAESEVDPAWMDGVEDAELLDDRERGVVPHQDCSRADPQRAGGVGDQCDEQRRRRAGDAGVEVVLGHPVAPVAGGLGSLGEIDGVGDRLTGGGPARDGNEIEDGQRDRTGWS